MSSGQSGEEGREEGGGGAKVFTCYGSEVRGRVAVSRVVMHWRV